MENKLRFGIVGTGSMASTMLSAFRELSNVDVTAVCSASSQRAAAFAKRYGLQSSYGDLQQFLSTEAIDAVYIANSNLEHHTTAIAALSSGKAVLCEKPFAVNVQQGAAVIEAARASRVLFMEAIWTSFLPAYARLFDVIRSEAFGVATNLRFDFGYPIAPEHHPSLFAPAGGGVLLDRAGYGISFALTVLGPVEAVEALLKVDHQGVNVGASLQLAHRLGGQSQICVSYTSLLSNSATVACTRGMVGLSAPTIGAEELFFQHAGRPDAPHTANSRSGLKSRVIDSLRRHPFVRHIKAARSRPETERYPYGTNQYLAQARHFVELVRAGSTESAVNTLDHSLAVLRALEAASTAGSIERQTRISHS